MDSIIIMARARFMVEDGRGRGGRGEGREREGYPMVCDGGSGEEVERVVIFPRDLVIEIENGGRF